MSDFKKEIEAILFSAGRAVRIQELQLLLNLKNPGLIRESVREIISEYEVRDSPLMIVEEGEGWKLTVKEKFLPMVQRINPHTELSKTILETLSVIAWKQPALQSDVIKIRTNKAYEHIDELERLGFVSKERHGRSFLLKVTQKFLDYFDLPNADAIKEVFKGFKDIEAAAKKKSQEPAKPLEPEKKVSGFQTFSDELPPLKMPKPEGNVEVYEIPPEELRKEEELEAAEEEGKAALTSQPPEKPLETPEEKARRLARELLGEELPKPKVVEEREGRRLHPKLEEFIAGIAEEPEKEEAEEAPEEAEEEPPAEEAPEQAEPEEEQLTEEFPGQFTKTEEEKPKRKR
jgi:segregation and condensation protein B